MPRFARMIGEGMVARGHEVEYWTSPQNGFTRIPIPSDFVKKWLGYADQFILYPHELKRAVDQAPDETLFVVTDQALGMWVHEITDRPHVIHCHDFMALRSSLGEIPENPTSWTGKQYQRLIRKGFSIGSHFISVSRKTQSDLHRFLHKEPTTSEVVYNGLNYTYSPMSPEDAWESLAAKVPHSRKPPILHIGGNQWYKNRSGVLELYRAYASQTHSPHPLWMIGASPTAEMISIAEKIPSNGMVLFLTGWQNQDLRAAYSVAAVLLFPSLDEGFGWPIAEAMACGCAVITTDQEPMTEVGGDAAFYLPRLSQTDRGELDQWAQSGAEMLRRVTELSVEELSRRKERGLIQSARFRAETALNGYEKTYREILQRTDHSG